MEYIFKCKSSIGNIIISSDGKSITGLWFENQKYFASTLDKNAEEKDLEVFRKIKKWLDRYFKGENPKIDFDLKPKGSEFRQRVWNTLLSIPYGKIVTYKEIAEKVFDLEKGKISYRAIGGAVGHNPISIIIPCHRVVGSDKSLTGYAGGIDKKKFLLNLEGIDISELKTPKKGTAL